MQALKFVALVVIGVVATAPALAENWRLSASATATETYTSNANYSPQGEATSDFATALTAALNVHGEGARLKLNGSIAVTGTWYAGETQNNSVAPTVNLTGNLEAIEHFAFVDATANISQTFASPFGPQPGNLVNATTNRYTQQSYSVSPYIKGVLGSTNISYQVRDDNYWTAASSFGNASNVVPNTYGNQLSASMSSGTSPLGWRMEYNRFEYDNGTPINNSSEAIGKSITQVARLIVPYQIDPQVQVAGRVGYEDNRFPQTNAQQTKGIIYGAGLQWSPTERTQIGGYWEHQFFGSSFSWQLSHRLPNASISASVSRGLSSFPQLALLIPAGATVAQFLDAAFTTRIPDPALRAQAVEEFLARTGLPPTLAAPVNFYGTSITLQNAQNVSLVLLGSRNAITFSVFNLSSDAVSRKGEVLPPALQFGQNNTQTGAGVSYNHQVSGQTNLGANASYSRTVSDVTEGTLANVRSNNWNAGLTLSSQFGPKTAMFAGVTYSLFTPTGTGNASNTSSLNAFVGINYKF